MDAQKKTVQKPKKIFPIILFAMLLPLLYFRFEGAVNELVIYLFATLALLALASLVFLLVKKLVAKGRLSAGSLEVKNGNTQETRHVGLERIFASVGLLLIFISMFTRINPFIFLGVYLVMLPIMLYVFWFISMLRNRSFWKKSPSERLEIWNKQNEQGKFKQNQELYYHYLSSYYNDIEDFELALQYTLQSESIALEKEAPNKELIDLSQANRATYLIELGRWQEAADVLEALEARQDVYQAIRGTIAMGLTRIALWKQDVASARRFVDEVAMLNTHGTPANLSWVTILQAEVSFAEGNVDEAMKKASDVIKHATRQHILSRAKQLKEQIET